jgi:hypothetical protein
LRIPRSFTIPSPSTAIRTDWHFTRTDWRSTRTDGHFTRTDERFTRTDGRFTRTDGCFTRTDGPFTCTDKHPAGADEYLSIPHAASEKTRNFPLPKFAISVSYNSPSILHHYEYHTNELPQNGAGH